MTQHFKRTEFLRSKKAEEHNIKNTPTQLHVLLNLQRMANLLEEIREKYKHPITITSGYRCEQLNEIVGGAKGSQHLQGEACDIIGYDNAKLFQTIKTMMDDEEIKVGQLIWEKGDEKQPQWVHVSLPNYRHTNEVKRIL